MYGCGVCDCSAKLTLPHRQDPFRSTASSMKSLGILSLSTHISRKMTTVPPFADAAERLRAAGLRPTRQRLALAKMLLESGDRHVTAEQLHGEARRGGIAV